MNFVYKPVFILCAMLLCFSLIGVTANAQNQFTSSMNFESSKLPYNWHTSAWTACTGECNSGIQTRSVTCKDNAGNDAPSGAPAWTECNHTPEPESVRQCDLPDCQWVAGACPSHVHNQNGSNGEGDGIDNDGDGSTGSGGGDPDDGDPGVN